MNGEILTVKKFNVVRTYLVAYTQSVAVKHECFLLFFVENYVAAIKE